MLSLAEAQDNFIATINNGPSALLPDLFSGLPDRVMLGLKAHANTISHARLIALEDSFPRTKMAMGETEFGALSHSYVETDIARCANTNLIGADFADFLAEATVGAQFVDLVRIEWAYLESYHAADAQALSLADIGVIDPSGMLNLRIDVHPAAQLVRLTSNRFDLVDEIGVLNDGAILITRPEVGIALNAVDDITALLFDEALQECKICNLLELAIEESDEQAALAPIINLISAGALVQKG